MLTQLEIHLVYRTSTKRWTMLNVEPVPTALRNAPARPRKSSTENQYLVWMRYWIEFLNGGHCSELFLLHQQKRFAYLCDRYTVCSSYKWSLFHTLARTLKRYHVCLLQILFSIPINTKERALMVRATDHHLRLLPPSRRLSNVPLCHTGYLRSTSFPEGSGSPTLMATSPRCPPWPPRCCSILKAVQMGG